MFLQHETCAVFYCPTSYQLQLLVCFGVPILYDMEIHLVARDNYGLLFYVIFLTEREYIIGELSRRSYAAGARVIFLH